MALAALLAACGGKKEARIAGTAGALGDRDRRREPDSATYTAEIRSRYETDLSFQVGGKLVSRAVDVGATVKKGQLLAQLDQTDQQLGVDAARGAVPAAQSDLDRSRSEEARFRDLLERGLTTRAQYQAQQTAVRPPRPNYRRPPPSCASRSSGSGTPRCARAKTAWSRACMVEVGTVVAAGQRALSIARPSELEAVFDVPDGRIGEVKTGSSVLINPLSGEGAAWAGRVREISPSADPVTRTYQVRTTIVNPPAVVASRHDGERDAGARRRRAQHLAAVHRYLPERRQARGVDRDQRDSTVELRAVTVERYDTDRVYVAEGIRTGERVVTAGVHRLSPGEKVKLAAEKPQ